MLGWVSRLFGKTETELATPPATPSVESPQEYQSRKDREVTYHLHRGGDFLILLKPFFSLHRLSQPDHFANWRFSTNVLALELAAQRMATVTDRQVEFWDVSCLDAPEPEWNPTLLGQCAIRPMPGRKICLSPDGKRLLLRRQAELFCLNDRGEMGVGMQAGPWFGFLGDGGFAVAEGETTRVYNEKGQTIGSWPLRLSQDCSSSSDGVWLLDGETLIDTRRGVAMPLSLRGWEKAAFSPQSRWLALSGSQGLSRVIHLDSLEVLEARRDEECSGQNPPTLIWLGETGLLAGRANGFQQLWNVSRESLRRSGGFALDEVRGSAGPYPIAGTENRGIKLCREDGSTLAEMSVWGSPEWLSESHLRGGTLALRREDNWEAWSLLPLKLRLRGGGPVGTSWVEQDKGVFRIWPDWHSESPLELKAPLDWTVEAPNRLVYVGRRAENLVVTRSYSPSASHELQERLKSSADDAEVFGMLSELGQETLSQAAIWHGGRWRMLDAAMGNGELSVRQEDPEGRRLAVQVGQQWKIWGLEQMAWLDLPVPGCQALTFLPKGGWVAYDGKALVWPGGELPVPSPPQGETPRILSLGDDRVAMLAAGQLTVWSLRSAGRSGPHRAQANKTLPYTHFELDGEKRVALQFGDLITVHELEPDLPVLWSATIKKTGECRMRFSPGGDRILAWSHRAGGGQRAWLKVWSLSPGSRESFLREPPDFFDIHWLDKERFLIVSHASNSRLLVYRAEDLSACVGGLDLWPNGEWAAWGRQGTFDTSPDFQRPRVRPKTLRCADPSAHRQDGLWATLLA